MVLRHAFTSMGCPCAIQIEAAAPEIAGMAINRAVAEVDRLDRKYSHYREDSLLAQWCASAGTARVHRVDDESAHLLDVAALLHQQSGGLFDVTAAPLTRLWDGQRGSLPDTTEVERARALVGWRRVHWQRPELRLTRAGMRLDFGGLVKEYAADRAARICQEAGVAHGAVDLGGDLSLIGAHADGSPWRVGIRHPRASGALASIDLTHGGLATSGDYERALVVDGRRYCHIVDPRSGRPVDSYASVSVIADGCLLAGAAATLAMLLGIEAGSAYLRELGLAHLTVTVDGEVGGSVARVRALPGAQAGPFASK